MTDKLEIPADIKQLFLDAWFEETTYDGQEGVFLTRTLKVGDIRDFLDNARPDWPEFADEMQDIVVELIPAGAIQYCLLGGDEMFDKFYLQDNLPDWLDLARSAGVEITEQHLRNLIC